MYDMYPDYTQGSEESAPFSERGLSGLGHPDGYPISPKPVTEHPVYPAGYEYVRSQPLRSSVEVALVEDVQEN